LKIEILIFFLPFQQKWANWFHHAPAIWPQWKSFLLQDLYSLLTVLDLERERETQACVLLLSEWRPGRREEISKDIFLDPLSTLKEKQRIKSNKAEANLLLISRPISPPYHQVLHTSYLEL
jgi:hypothetical protein